MQVGARHVQLCHSWSHKPFPRHILVKFLINEVSITWKFFHAFGLPITHLWMFSRMCLILVYGNQPSCGDRWVGGYSRFVFSIWIGISWGREGWWNHKLWITHGKTDFLPPSLQVVSLSHWMFKIFTRCFLHFIKLEKVHFIVGEHRQFCVLWGWLWKCGTTPHIFLCTYYELSASACWC